MTSFLDLQMAVRQTACHAWTNSLSCLDQQLVMPGPTACHAQTNSFSCLDQQLVMSGTSARNDVITWPAPDSDIIPGTTAGNDVIPGYPMGVTSQAAEVTSSAYQLAMMSQLPAVYYLFRSGQWHPIQTTSCKLLHTPWAAAGNNVLPSPAAGCDVMAAGSDVILWPAADSDDLPGLAAGGKGSASMVSYLKSPP